MKTTKPNTWASGRPLTERYPRLTDAERTFIERFDEPLTNEYSSVSRAHSGITTNIPWYDGEPIEDVMVIGPSIKGTIMRNLGIKPVHKHCFKPSKYSRPMTKEEVCDEFDLRPEWLEEIINNPKKRSHKW
jgi:hypothetical protein